MSSSVGGVYGHAVHRSPIDRTARRGHVARVAVHVS